MVYKIYYVSVRPLTCVDYGLFLGDLESFEVNPVIICTNLHINLQFVG